MGDVSLTVPVIKGVLEANPDLHITLVTREFFAPFFHNIPRLDLVFPQFNGRHKGFLGIFRLYADLQKNGPHDAIVDLHGVLRTRIISFLFNRAGVPKFAIEKGRKEKKFILKSSYIRILKHTTTRYLETFSSAGFSGSIGKAPYLNTQEQAIIDSRQYLDVEGISPDKLRIGLAPFATHVPKMWGVANFKELIALINGEFDVHFFLFGGGSQEIGQLKELKQFSSNIHLVAGEMKLPQELALMSSLDLMITMDSSNMHLASLSGVPTVSIWGGTHPAFGFYALGQPTEYSLQTPASSLKCRPCSVFGNKPCIYPTPRCMEMVKPDDVFNKLKKFSLLNRKQNKTTLSSSKE